MSDYADDWLNSALQQVAVDSVPTRDVSQLTMGELARLSSGLPHRKREPVTINGVVKKETLKERLTREAHELDIAITALVNKRARRDAQLKHLERFPVKDPFKDGTTLIFQKSFPHTPDTKYSYSAVRMNGLYYITGARTPQGLDWDEFVSWMGLGVDEVHRVTPTNATVKKVIG